MSLSEQGWAERAVTDIAAGIPNATAGGPFGSNLVQADYVKHGVPVIRGQNMGLGRWVAGEFVFVTPEKAKSLSVNLARPGDIVFTQRGTLGQVAIVPAAPVSEYLLSQSQMKLTPDARKADAIFLYYCFIGPAQQEKVRQSAVQTGVPHTNLGILRTTLVLMPPLAEQRRIAGVLGALDSKIEHNGQLAANLGKFLKHVGWALCVSSSASLRPLSSVARFINGKAFTKDANGRGRPILRIKELNNGVTDRTPCSDIAAATDNIAQHFDLLFSWSGSLGVYRWEGVDALINQHIFKVVPVEEFPLWLAETWIGQHLPHFQSIARDKATTMGHIQRQHLDDALVPVPSPDELRNNRQVLDAVDELRASLARERIHLSKVRDLLLPKLIAGLIRVPHSYDPDDVLGTVAEEAGAAV